MKNFTYLAITTLLLFSFPLRAQDQAIEIKDHLYMPASITVKTGTRITWANKDTDPHTVVSQNNKFHSGALDTNDTYSYVFTAPGVYKYFCTLHPTMVGSITVE